ncbi:MAG: DUF3891 family protein [Trueperaceae bacterium]|nr:MAG: DUF3891 family protein [Trueperaceae bacterium]
MIVQTAEPGNAHFVIRQSDHASCAGQLAAAFGNDRFVPLYPRELMEFVTRHHDEGWDEVDAAALQDPNTGLPYHLTETPTDALLATGSRSPDFNERHHPFCGLLSSLHTCGIYQGRFGIIAGPLPMYSPEKRRAVETLISREQARQVRLKAILAGRRETAVWVEDVFLFYNYKRLQFFDLLALYFHKHHAAERSRTEFRHVPVRPGEEVTITVEPIDEAHYRLTPYPFAVPQLDIGTRGWFLHPQIVGTDLVELLEHTEPECERALLISA